MKSRSLAVCSLLILCGSAVQPASAAGPVGFSRGTARAPRGVPAVPGPARQSSPGFSTSVPVHQGAAVHSPVSASQVIIPPAGSRQATHTRTFVSAGPGRLPASAPFHFNQRHDFRRHHHFHGFQPFIFWEWPQYIGPGYVTAPFVTYMPYVPNGSWTLIEPGQSELRREDFGTRGTDRLARFDPTPQEVVNRMLTLAGVHKGDVVYDLGAGDGRIVIAAAKEYGIKAIGYEIDPGLAKLARENVRRQGVEKLVEIREQDFMSADLSPATVVTLYLSQDGNLAVRSKLLRELKPEARVVSYTFDMGDWQPKIVESYRDAGGDRHMLYLWQMLQPLLFSDGKR